MERKPLYNIESSNRPSVVCITGATGFIGSHVTARLLAAGHTVHAVCLPSDLADSSKTEHIEGLPRAAVGLRMFGGDVLVPGSIDDAIRGCNLLVHLAAVVDVIVKKKDRQRMIDVAMQGTRNVLESVNRTSTVTRVVMASSLASIVGPYQERGREHVYSEEDWSLQVDPENMTYHYAKRESEKLAWDICAKQDRWKLLTVNPGVVLGPLMAPQHAPGTPRLVVKIARGELPMKVDLRIPFVDVDDVAATICLLLFSPDACGRHIVSCTVGSTAEISDRMGAMFPSLAVPKYSMPYWLGYLITWLLPHVVGVDLPSFKYAFKGHLQVNNTKVQKILGLKYIDFDQTLRDTVYSCVDLGLVSSKTIKGNMHLEMSERVGDEALTSAEVKTFWATKKSE